MKKLSNPLEYAISKAKEIPIEGDRKRLYAVIVDKKGRVVSEHENSYIKSHPLQAKFAKIVGREDAIFLHAEMGCISKIRSGKAHSIYVARVNKNGNPVLAKPCEICSMAIALTTIEEVYWTE